MGGRKSSNSGNAKGSLIAPRSAVEFTQMARDGCDKLLKAIAQYHVRQGRKAWRAFL